MNLDEQSFDYGLSPELIQLSQQVTPYELAGLVEEGKLPVSAYQKILDYQKQSGMYSQPGQEIEGPEMYGEQVDSLFYTPQSEIDSAKSAEQMGSIMDSDFNNEQLQFDLEPKDQVAQDSLMSVEQNELTDELYADREEADTYTDSVMNAANKDEAINQRVETELNRLRDRTKAYENGDVNARDLSLKEQLYRSGDSALIKLLERLAAENDIDF
jgi:hypothetical protein